MKIDRQLLSELQSFPWMEQCGTKPPMFSFEIRQLSGWDQVSNAYARGWLERTERAQGDLTEYLSNRHPKEYQGVWNKLVREARPVVTSVVGPRAKEVAEKSGIGSQLENSVIWEVLGAVMEQSYAQVKPPKFFTVLLEVYRAGHLPCGWEDDDTVVIF